MKKQDDKEETTGLLEESSLSCGVASESQSQESSGLTYETAIEEAGYGRFHYMLLLLCGWAVSSDAVEILCVSFVLPAAGCDMNLSSSDKGWLNSSIFLGMMVGGYMWGSLADVWGRRAVLVWSLTVNALCGLASSFSQVFWLYLLCRFFSGIGVGGSMPVIFTYFTEFQPKNRRGPMISVLATFWMSGNILAAGLAWAVIPQTGLGYWGPSFTYNSWRIYVALCTIPALTSAILYVLMPESPRFLMQKGREREALRVFHRIQKTNRIRHSYVNFIDDKLKCKDVPQTQSSENQVRCRFCCLRCCISLASAGAQVLQASVNLFRRPLTKISLVMTVVYFTLSFGYYGLWMWFPELFKRIEITGGSPCQEIGFNITQSNASDCQLVGESTVYFEGFLTAVSNLPGNILTIILIDRVGRKLLLAGSMVISGVSVFFLWFVNNKVQSLAMSCLFGGISVIGWNALDVLGTELFPTEYRSTANGLMSAIGRIAAILGNQVFGQLVDVHCAVPMLLVAALMSFGGLIALKLPESRNRDLE